MRKYIDRKLFFILLGYMAAYHVVYISRRIILKFIENQAYENVAWSSVIFEPIIANFTTVPPIIILVLIASKIMINRNIKWVYLFMVHFILFVVYTLLITTGGGIYVKFAHGINIFKEDFFTSILFDSNLNFLGYVGFVTIIYSYYYIQMNARMETQELKLSQQLQKAKLQALKSQLNPHFLFNTLHGISSLVKNNPIKAQYMIGDLGDLLREVLLVKDRNMISVRKEMVILNKYIEIMRMRFSDHLSVKIGIDADVKEALIPSMLLQPIMENSFEHGYSYDLTDLEVDLSISKENDWLIINIKNNGAPISNKENNEGLGIPNVKERLNTLFGDKHAFSFSGLEKEAGVITSIKIPLIFDLQEFALADS